MSNEDASWHARGERNGYEDAKAGRAYRVAAVGPCQAYRRGYEFGRNIAELEREGAALAEK
jgi:hypothetical protein